jgi:hypothetical protein
MQQEKHGSIPPAGAQVSSVSWQPSKLAHGSDPDEHTSMNAAQADFEVRQEFYNSVTTIGPTRPILHT